jgi:hypothetical protein
MASLLIKFSKHDINNKNHQQILKINIFVTN